jgi:hypothetical protein
MAGALVGIDFSPRSASCARSYGTQARSERLTLDGYSSTLYGRHDA